MLRDSAVTRFSILFGTCPKSKTVGLDLFVPILIGRVSKALYSNRPDWDRSSTTVFGYNEPWQKCAGPFRSGLTVAAKPQHEVELVSSGPRDQV